MEHLLAVDIVQTHCNLDEPVHNLLLGEESIPRLTLLSDGAEKIPLLAVRGDDAQSVVIKEAILKRPQRTQGVRQTSSMNDVSPFGRVAVGANLKHG